MEDPREIYSVLGSLTSAVASLSQTLNQVAATHDRPTSGGQWRALDSSGTRASAYRVSWELHRAAEMLRQVNDTIGRAHNAEAQITYMPRDNSPAHESPRRSADRGLGL